MRINSRKCNHTRVNRFKNIYSTADQGTRITISTYGDLTIYAHGIEGGQEFDVKFSDKECLALFEVLKAKFEGKDLDIDL